MKKTLLIIFAVAAFSQVKAQQLFRVKPADSLKNNLLEKYFNIKPGSRPQLFQLQGNPIPMLADIDTQVKVSSFDHMPIAFLQGYSKMPIAKLDGAEKMPVTMLGGGNLFKSDSKKITP